ncbi:MAG: hypothetical protein ACR2M9_04165 [Cyanophyceae cyanobacterium]
MTLGGFINFWRGIGHGIADTFDSLMGKKGEDKVRADEDKAAGDPPPPPPPPQQKPVVNTQGVEQANNTFDTSSMGVMGQSQQFSGNNTPHW